MTKGSMFFIDMFTSQYLWFLYREKSESYVRRANSKMAKLNQINEENEKSEAARNRETNPR